MVDNAIQVAVNESIDRLAVAEKTTKQELIYLSRTLLTYVIDTSDILTVNRLLGVLTPKNRQYAVLFFREFLPWDWDKEGNRFTKKFGNPNAVAKRVLAINEFLADDKNNFWTWVAENTEEAAKKKKDYAGQIAKIVARALKDNDEGLSPAAVMQAVHASLSIEDMVIAMQEMQAAIEEANDNIQVAA